ncbi:MAG: hypothetical protein Q8940_05820 [Bacteroidota bacterium]|nr:hypothetical protein [Bacteroidota bacterium]
MIRIVTLSLVLLLIFEGCGKKNRKVHQLTRKGQAHYSIRIKTFSQRDSAEHYAEDFSKTLQRDIYITPSDTSEKSARYAVEIGEFSSSFSAGSYAYKLLKKNVIKNFSLVYNNLPVHDDFANVFFVGSYKNKASVFYYDLKTSSVHLFWSNPKQLVVELSVSKDGKTAFFLSASEFGRETIFPYINNLKLYRINMAEMKVEKLCDLGNGLQLYSNWISPDLFRVIFNAFDKRKNTFVVQSKLSYNSNGKLLSNEKVVYDIEKEKYPVPSLLNTEYPSDNNKLNITFSTADDHNVLSLIDSLRNKKVIYSTHQNLNTAEWWGKGKYFIFSTYDFSRTNIQKRHNPETSKLFIYSIEDKKLICQWQGEGYKNFILRGDLLIFDDGFDSNSKIMIFNLKDNKMIDTIAMQGGCGIRNISTFLY